MTSRLVVRTHVARDLLQSAALFRNEKLVVWEYVSNGLQYVDPGIAPVVRVTLDSRGRTIVVEDNGRGMDLAGLQNFFVMHGENVDRRAGRCGRGRFGTGKSAAFGIGRSLRVTSVCNGFLNQVELTRSAIEAAGEGEVPVQVLRRDVPVGQPNGTVVEVLDLQSPRLDQGAVIRYVERHLAHWRGRPRVIINTHECEFREPPAAEVHHIVPEGDLQQTLGSVQLTIKVAHTALDAELQGIAVYANDVWLSSTLAGLEGQPLVNHIFGEIDVPKLDDETQSVPAFDQSRSMQLNPANPIVQSLYAFIGAEVERIRRRLIRQEQDRRAEAEVRRLQREADQIADMINRDFSDFTTRVQRVRARGGRGRDEKQDMGKAEQDGPLRSSKDGEPAERVAEEGGPGGDHGIGEAGGGTADHGPDLRPKSEGADRGVKTDAQQKRRSGGFQVAFEHLGESEPRAKYVRDERVIYVNLDHVQIKAALGSGSVDDPMFRRLSYEVAFSEYAIALASELAANDEYIDPTDPIFDIRETINRMAVRAAALYSSVGTGN